MRCWSIATYARPGTARDAWTLPTHECDGAPSMFGATFVQVRPPSRVSWTLPSSVPTQITSGSSALSEIDRIVLWYSARVLSGVIGPPESRCFSGSSVVRSGLIMSQLSPPSRVRKRTLPP